VKDKIRGYIQLTRPYAAYLIPSIVLIAAICNGKPSVQEFLILLLIGVFLHIVLMVQNDYFDVEIDKRSPFVSDRPLVTGIASIRGALILWLSASIISLIITKIFFSNKAFLSLLLTLLLFTLYNKYSKNIPGMEYILGLAAFTSGLFGAYAVSDNLSTLSLIISLLALLKYVFNVGVSANMKDLKYDRLSGLKTKLYSSSTFIAYAILLKLIYVTVSFIPILIGVVSTMIYGFPIPLIILSLCSIAILVTLPRIFSASDRSELVTYAGRQELLSYFILPLASMSTIVDYQPLLFLLFLFGPPIWIKFSLRVFFKKDLPHE